MGGADDKPVWERIADLGFADAVESKGFKRVGKTHWRRDGDGIVHHVKLYRGFSVQPGSFRDFQGTFIPGLDALSERVGEAPLSHRIPYGTAPVHFDGFVFESYALQEWRNFLQRHPDAEKINWLGFVSGVLEPLPYYNPRLTIDNDSGAWVASDEVLGEVAETLTQAWLFYKCRTISQDIDYLSLYNRVIRSGVSKAKAPHLRDFLFAILADDVDVVQRLWATLLARVPQDSDVDTEFERLRRKRERVIAPINWAALLKTQTGQKRLEREAVRNVFVPMQRVRQIQDHLRILGYCFDADHLDLDALESAERDPKWGPWLNG